MEMREDVSLKDYCAMRLGGSAKFFASFSSEQQLQDILQYANAHKLPWVVIGEGSNTIFTDDGFPGVVLKNEIKGFAAIEQDELGATLKIGGGEHWDDVVRRSSELGLSGIEALSMIPGSAGAAPVQNIGAYGQEIKDTLLSLRAYDTVGKDFKDFSNAECQFSHRSSMFKVHSGRYIITEIVLKLSKTEMRPPFYDSLQNFLDQNSILDYSPASIRSAVMSIRASVLPDPSMVANNGSFFIAPMVDRAKLDEIIAKNPSVADWPRKWYWELPDGRIKIAPGRLADNLGLKNWHDPETGMATWKNHALVLVNEHADSYAKLEAFKAKYLQKIEDAYGVTLEQEPVVIRA